MSEISRKSTVAVLAIGTEITSGEVVNSNASTLAANLTELGFTCDHHVAVPDNQALMSKALSDLIATHDIVLVTGGLGPTTDDVTRDVVARVAGQKLKWNEADWQRIVQRLQTVGAPIAESNRQQAFFPESAIIYPSRHGTASAFSIEIKNCLVMVLPGPPKEIEGLWIDHIQALLKARSPQDKDQTPDVWHCLGQSESRLGEIVEDALSNSGFITGYRSHAPYIHVKVWIPATRREDFEKNWRKKLEDAVQPWLVGRNDFDAAKELVRSVNDNTTLTIIDLATAGYAATRIFKAQDKRQGISIITTNDENFPVGEVAAIAKITADSNTGDWTVSLQSSTKRHTHSEPSRYKGPANTERLKAYVAEKSFIKLIGWLQN